MFGPGTSQAEVVARSLTPMLHSLFHELKGGLVFAYGVTNSGKTHTMIGTRDQPGVLIELVRTLLDKAAAIARGDFSGLGEQVMRLPHNPDFQLRRLRLALTACEVYNEEVHDLLAKARGKLVLKEDEHHHCIIRGLEELALAEDDEKELLGRVLARRSTGDNSCNFESSRAHTIFKIKTVFEYGRGAEECCEEERSFCVVDLAGSERANRSKMDESCSINKSLLILGRCLQALREKGQQVPYRESRLTRIIYEYFLEANNLTMLVCVNPQRASYPETLKVLEYAALAKQIKQSNTPISRRPDPKHDKSAPPRVRVFTLEESKVHTPGKRQKDIAEELEQKITRLQESVVRMKKSEQVKEACYRGQAVNEAFELIYNEHIQQAKREH